MPASHVHVDSHGVELSLAISRHAYPRNALIRVAVEARNISRRDVWVDVGGAMFPGKSTPQVQVLDAAGNPLYPPAIEDYQPLPGPPPTPERLPPGASVRSRPLVILRGDRLQATVDVLNVSHEGATLTTPSLFVHLVNATPPTITFTASAGAIEAAITPVTKTAGPMYFVDAAHCQPAVIQHLAWSRGPGRLVAGCANPTEWVFVAGWLNHPVADGHYAAPAVTGTATPLPTPAPNNGLGSPTHALTPTPTRVVL